jgi:xanthine dehydrogenase accessory factor
MLAHAGIAADQAERIRGPAGLFESGKSASAIALSILAEIMQVRNAAVHDTAFRPDVYLLPATQLSGLPLPFNRMAAHR